MLLYLVVVVNFGQVCYCHLKQLNSPSNHFQILAMDEGFSPGRLVRDLS